MSLRVVDCAQARGERVHRSCKHFGLMRMLGEEASLVAMIVDDKRASAGAEGCNRDRDRGHRGDPRSGEAT